MKQVKLVEKLHQWEGTAIVRGENGLEEINLGVVQDERKLKETGAKELFDNIPSGAIAVEVKKLDDITFTYEMDSEEFKKVAKLSDTPVEEKVQE